MISPGASSVPANSEPIITVFAPAASAFATSPEYLMPPSAMIATPDPFAAATASEIAVSCGTPTPATIRVVQPAHVIGGGVRIHLGLLDVAGRDEALELALAVDDEQLLDPVLVEQAL